MNNDMLAARRRIMMAKKKPSFHLGWSRDYSFFSTGESTWYIDTPEKMGGVVHDKLRDGC